LCHPYFSSYLRLNASHHIVLLAAQSSEAFDVLFVKSVKFCAQIEVPDVITHANLMTVGYGTFWIARVCSILQLTCLWYHKFIETHL